MNLKEIIESEELQLKKLNELVSNSLHEEELLTSRLVELESETNLTLGQKLADGVATFGGSWLFIFIFFFIFLAWIFSNVVFLNLVTFDPYPFILLNLVLSCIAALQAPIIMMSQNRKEENDRKRSRSDYLINLKAEMEIRNLHGKIDWFISEEMKSLFEIQREQLKILTQLQAEIAILQNKTK